MSKSLKRRLSMFSGVLALTVISSLSVIAQETSPVKTEPAPTRYELEKADYEITKPFAKTILIDKKLTKRLPNYYKDIITSEQRDEIYKIQASYHPLLSLLAARLELLKEEHDAKIKAVLDEKQLAEIERLTEEAKTKREAKAGTKTETKRESKSATDTPPATK